MVKSSPSHVVRKTARPVLSTSSDGSSSTPNQLSSSSNKIKEYIDNSHNSNNSDHNSNSNDAFYKMVSPIVKTNNNTSSKTRSSSVSSDSVHVVDSSSSGGNQTMERDKTMVTDGKATKLNNNNEKEEQINVETDTNKNINTTDKNMYAGASGDEEEEQPQQQLVSTDRERQILLLMLLAQVCSLHDATPRTFTVHVLSLYERGILDSESISFLFDLGLVPPNKMIMLQSTPSSQSSSSYTIHKNTSSFIEEEEEEGEEQFGIVQDVKLEDNSSQPSPNQLPTSNDNHSKDPTMGEIIPYRKKKETQPPQQEQQIAVIPKPLTPQKWRIQQTAIIREQLQRYESHKSTAKAAGGQTTSTSFSSSSNNNNNNNNATMNQHQNSSWTVENHPLSLSRYQREFVQRGLLNSGAFGDVYRATNKLDGKDYAIKRVAFSATGYSNDSVQTVIREVQCLAQCDHVNCVRYYTSWLEPSWMTGSGNVVSSADDVAGKELQRKMLTDIHRLVLEDDVDVSSSILIHDQPSKNEDEYLEQSAMTKESWNIQDKSPLCYHHNVRNTNPGLSAWSFDRSSTGDNDKYVDDWNQLESHKTNTLDSTYTEDYTFHDNKNNNESDYSEWTRDDESSRHHIYESTYYNHNNQWSTAQSSRSKPAPKQISTRRKQQQQQKQQQSYTYQICLFVQMQMCHPSTLADWIRQRNNGENGARKSNSEQLAQRAIAAFDIFRQIVDGLVHVHSKGIIHRDLKPANIFAADDGVFKIGDFGLSKLLWNANTGTDFESKNNNDSNGPSSSIYSSKVSSVSSTRNLSRLKMLEYPSDSIESFENNNIDPKKNKSSSTATKSFYNSNGEIYMDWQDPLTKGVGTASYAAPEQIKSNTYGIEADIFSLGLILLELFSSFTSEHERGSTFHECRFYQKIPPKIEKIYPEVANLISQCCQSDPRDRPTARDIQLMGIFQESKSFSSLFSKTMSKPFKDKCEPSNLDIQDLRRELQRKDKELERQRADQVLKDIATKKEMEKLKSENKRLREELINLKKKFGIETHVEECITQHYNDSKGCHGANFEGPINTSLYRSNTDNQFNIDNSFKYGSSCHSLTSSDNDDY